MIEEKTGPYTKVAMYHFEVDNETWAIISCDASYAAFEETEKNGQEDCHIYAEIRLTDDSAWKLDASSRENIEMYRSGDTADHIEAFFDAWGVPVPATDAMARIADALEDIADNTSGLDESGRPK